nr:MAG TPA: hypothetical protein [Caudoviricetes sp.]
MSNLKSQKYSVSGISSIIFLKYLAYALFSHLSLFVKS